VTDLFGQPDDTTPLAPEERKGLRQSWITHRADLNEAEQANIVDGAAWARRRRGHRADDLLTDRFCRALHEHMFGEVWRWAGSYRQSERNIGIEAWRVPEALGHLFGDLRYWIAHETFPPDEIAIQLHHRLVAIHPFPNGNGRHARLMADLLIERLGREPFSWAGGSLAGTGELRARQIAALRAADAHDMGPLLVFARS